MADKAVSGVFTIDGAHRYIIGNPSRGTTGGSLLVHIDNDNSLSGATITVQGRAAGSGFTWDEIPYVRLNLAGTVSDATVVSATLSGTAIISIPVCDGMEVALNVTGGAITGSARAIGKQSTL